jgi:hypothetical protein
LGAQLLLNAVVDSGKKPKCKVLTYTQTLSGKVSDEECCIIPSLASSNDENNRIFPLLYKTCSLPLGPNYNKKQNSNIKPDDICCMVKLWH